MVAGSLFMYIFRREALFMWLLKLHFSISVLCLLTFLGFREVFKEQIKKNGYGLNQNKKIFSFISFILFFFVPILNVLMIISLFLMILVKKTDLDDVIRKE